MKKFEGERLKLDQKKSVALMFVLEYVMNSSQFVENQNCLKDAHLTVTRQLKKMALQKGHLRVKMERLME